MRQLYVRDKVTGVGTSAARSSVAKKLDREKKKAGPTLHNRGNLSTTIKPVKRNHCDIIMF